MDPDGEGRYPLTKLCRWLGVTPSGFYAWQQCPESTHEREDRRLKVRVQASFAESKQRYGSPRIHEDLIEQDEQVSRKRVIRLMQEGGLKARTRKRFTLTTMSDHDQPVAANLLDRQFDAAAPNQRWVGDTTEFVIGSSGKLYLAVVLDLFSRFAVGWAVSAVNDRHLTIKALEMALKRRCPEIGLLHHSDQGCTYASADYQALLDARGIVCSMSRRGNCHDNAVMESFFSTVKSELADRFHTYGDAKMELFDYIEVFYNQRRRHSTLGQISPAAFERRANEEGVDPMENRQGRGFPQAPHPLSFESPQLVWVVTAAGRWLAKPQNTPCSRPLLRPRATHQAHAPTVPRASGAEDVDGLDAAVQAGPQGPDNCSLSGLRRPACHPLQGRSASGGRAQRVGTPVGAVSYLFAASTPQPATARTSDAAADPPRF